MFNLNPYKMQKIAWQLNKSANFDLSFYRDASKYIR